MTDQPYDFIETEDEPCGTTMTDAFDSEDDQDGEAVQQGPPTDHGPPDEVSLEQLYTEHPETSGVGFSVVDGSEIEDVDIDADELAEEIAEGEASDHETVVGENVEDPDPTPTLLESIIGFFRGLVR